MKQVDVRFGSGQDVLNAYWGYLSDGGLVLRDGDGLDEGQAVSLNVEIASSKSRYLLAGRVVRCRGDGTVIAFQPGEPHDMLLTEAISETEHVPPRRCRRFRVKMGCTVRWSEHEQQAEIRNLSETGCRFEVDSSFDDLHVGRPVSIHTDEFTADGVIVWAQNKERGIRFAGRKGEDDSPTSVASYIERVATRGTDGQGAS